MSVPLAITLVVVVCVIFVIAVIALISEKFEEYLWKRQQAKASYEQQLEALERQIELQLKGDLERLKREQEFHDQCG
jgi:Tfp pilus assembly protein PilE